MVFFSIAVLVPPTVGSAWAARSARWESRSVDTGIHNGSNAGATTVFREVVAVPGALWMRLKFAEHELGRTSAITLTSRRDGGQQRLDARTIQSWGGMSACFNGDAVELTLEVGPNDHGVFARVDRVMVGDRTTAQNKPASDEDVVQSLCDGDDDRVPSTDARVGRLLIFDEDPGCSPIMVCTAWLVSNGALLTAGHCADFLPSGTLPDGVLDLDANDLVEFDVPESASNGDPVCADPSDQYPIVPGTVRFAFTGFGAALGGDWAVFACAPNSNTGLLPHVAQGTFFRMSRETPLALLEDIRITGYGADTGSDNVTLQTDVGIYQGEFDDYPGIDIFGVIHMYRADTEHGNSGGPIIWENTGFAIGVHSQGTCDAAPLFGNYGTSFEFDPLESDVNTFPGSSISYVDAADYPGTNETGTIFEPFNTVQEGVDSVSSGGILSVVRGSYPGALTITKSMTIRAPVGTVTIGP
jgi:hypothetical protein